MFQKTVVIFFLADGDLDNINSSWSTPNSWHDSNTVVHNIIFAHATLPVFSKPQLISPLFSKEIWWYIAAPRLNSQWLTPRLLTSMRMRQWNKDENTRGNMLPSECYIKVLLLDGLQTKISLKTEWPLSYVLWKEKECHNLFFKWYNH